MAIDIVHAYWKLQREFGRPISFTDSKAELVWTTMEQPENMDGFIPRSKHSHAVQAAPNLTTHEVNTKPFKLSNNSMDHMEGSWPKEISCSEQDQVLRWRRRIEKDGDYIAAMEAMCTTAERVLRQNCTTDIYERYFESTTEMVEGKSASVRSVAVLVDPFARTAGAKRAVSCLSWSPEDNGNVLAAGYANLKFQQGGRVSREATIWDLNNQTTPVMMLKPPSHATTLEYNLKDSHLLVSGCLNGLLAAFDTRAGSAPVAETPVEKSHRDPVWGMTWVQSKSGTDFVTTSSDGLMMTWDMRKLVDATDRIPLSLPGSGDDTSDRYYVPPCGRSIAYDVGAGPAKFLVGTEQGGVILVNKKAKNPADRCGMHFTGHHGPVVSIVRHPFFSKFFASVGDWSVQTWFDELRTPIISTAYQSCELVDAAWGPTRPGVLFTARADGAMNIWELTQKQTEPIVTSALSQSPLQCLKVFGSTASATASDAGRYIAAGDVSGSVSVVCCSDYLVHMQPGEKQTMSLMLERESRREKIAEMKRKEVIASARRAALLSQEQADADAKQKPGKTAREILADAEKHFFDTAAAEFTKEEAGGA